jgi:peptidoglycan/LPS O-acetylase OafA/YrhL
VVVTMRSVVFGLVLGVLASAWVGTAARERTLAESLPSPWWTACLGLGVIAIGWVLANAAPRFAATLAGAAAPGAVYGAIVLAGDGDGQLAYGWSAVPVALVCLAIGAGLHAAHRKPRPWSARRSTAPRVPRLRTR